MARKVQWIRVGPSRRRARVALVEPLAELARIRVRENGEPLVELNASKIRIGPHWPTGRPQRLFCRATVAEMLERAQRLLPPGYQIVVFSAWRSLEEQRAIYQRVYAELKAKHPHWPESILRRETNRFVHPPDAKVPPGHATGGAIDLTLAGPDGELLDMTAPYTWRTPEARRVAPTFSEGLSEEARRNRRLLIEVMSAVGFTNYGGEWWHWSYGDSCWAWRLGRKTAPYGPAQLPEEHLPPEALGLHEGVAAPAPEKQG